MELKEMITKLCSIKEERKRLEQEEIKLSTPIIQDLRRVREVYQYCLDAHKELAPSQSPNKPFVRRRFLFVLLFLFSPKTLAGGKMGHGLRAEIAKVMKIESSNVSHYHSNILFFYNVYSDFREDVNKLFEIVFDKLKKQ